MSRPMWKVLGHDTFAREDYFIGEYPSRAEAESAAREAERRHEQFQDEPLRDEVWIVSPEEESGSEPDPVRD